MRGDAQTIPTMALRSAREGSPPLQVVSTLLEIGVRNGDRAPFNWAPMRVDPRDAFAVVLHMEDSNALSYVNGRRGFVPLRSFFKSYAVANLRFFSTEVDVRNPANAARPIIITTVHPTVLHRPRRPAIKRVDAVRVVERDLVLAERTGCHCPIHRPMLWNAVVTATNKANSGRHRHQ
jgi:hypothetical protein